MAIIQCKGISFVKTGKGPSQSLTMRHIWNNEKVGTGSSIHRLHAHGHVSPVGTDGQVVGQVTTPASGPELIVFWFRALRPPDVAAGVIQMRPRSVRRIGIGVAFDRSWTRQITVRGRAPAHGGHVRTGTAVAPRVNRGWLERLWRPVARWMGCDRPTMVDGVVEIGRQWWRVHVGRRTWRMLLKVMSEMGGQIAILG